MVVGWFVGDVTKTLYFSMRDSPLQFLLCGYAQIAIDVFILAQCAAYGSKSVRVHKAMSLWGRFSSKDDSL